MTVRTEPQGNRGAEQAVPVHLPVARLLRDQNAVSAIALGSILLATAFAIVMLLLQSITDFNDSLFQILSAVAHLAIILLVLFTYRLQVSRGRQQMALEKTHVEELRWAKQAAETANLAKARYLANVSHEIRSPLNAIYGYAQLIEQEADVRPQDAARVIRRCSEHMTSLVESLLDISRVENGLLRVRSEIVELPDFLEQVVWMMRPAAQAKGLEFIHEINGRVPAFVRTDQSRFRQALINLISNAIKFTEVGSITFRINYRGQIATFEIVDTGPGIAPEDHERIFDPYERAGTDDGAMRPGVGLGLPITKAIIEILGGKLEMESKLGKGTCFRITMMLGEVANALAPEVIRRRIVGYEGPRRSVLVVDDDPDQRAFLERFLQVCGFEVVAVPNGETAVQLTRQRSFDLCILDISLPGITGWETAAQIREQVDQDFVIVMASANAQEFHKPEYHTPVHDHFFVKPYKLDELGEAIGALLKLSWKYQAVGLEKETQADDAAIPAAALPHVERLRELVRIGHVRGIEAEIRMLAEAAPNSSRLVNALLTALDKFDLKGMERLLEVA